ncbi:MAG: protein kinase domain-containing protein [Prosthecobacter sp.]|uniref:protein kinase domain-containing protein n=1 Tax=Prosthecobacter sp. TaxID=1965333 RepID=UPI003901584D
MPDDPSAPQPTPTNYQRTTGGSHLRWQPPTPGHLQEMLPAYEIISVLGQGGMGAVYKSRQKSLDRIVAIKILPPEAGEDDMQFVERFKNEARTMAKMNHPAIVHVYDFGETTEGQLYIVMEYIDGTDVAKMIQSQGKLPEDYALSITAHVCDALGYAHTHGVVHRDIKPANVLINMEGQVKVADFGLAKATDPGQMGLTKTNMAMGTPDFVSPEALMPGVPLDGRADLYAVGVMLYNMLTGTIPRGAFRMPSVTLQTDARFDKIIGKSMEMDRELRYQTALDLRRDLDVILTAPQVKSGGEAQTAVPKQSLPQKPMGKSPGAPQQRSADTPARKEAAAKPAAAPVPKKSNAGMIYGIAAAVVVIAVAVFLFSGGGKKPAAAPQTVAEAKPEPKKPATSLPAPKKAVPVTAAPPSITTGTEKWVDALAQWFGGTKTNDDFTHDRGQAARAGRDSTMRPLPASAPLMRDMAVRARTRLDAENSGVRLDVRSAVNAAGKNSSYNVRIEPVDLRVSLGITFGKNFQPFADYRLPADFDFSAAHTLELRIMGDLLTVTLDGRKLGEHRDTQITAGHPALSGSKMWIESFEYANLDSGSVAPVATAAAAPAQPGDVLTFSGHRYQLVTERLPWPAARTKAETMGGHLAVIDTKEKLDWVWDKFGSKLKKTAGVPGSDHLFIGFHKPLGKDSWEWVTGGPLTIQPWMGEVPNGKEYNAHVASIYEHRFDYVRPRIFPPAPFLVEWDDDGTPKPTSTMPAAAPPAQIATATPAVPVATSPATAPAVPVRSDDRRRSADLIALVDVKRDVVSDPTTGANVWGSQNSSLIFTDMEKAGRIAAPVSLAGARAFEMELLWKKRAKNAPGTPTAESGYIALDVPVGAGRWVRVEVAKAGDKVIVGGRRIGNTGPGTQNSDGMRVVVRSQDDKLSVKINGNDIGAVSGLAGLAAADFGAHSIFKSEPLPAVYCARGDHEIAEWTVRALDGEVRLLWEPSLLQDARIAQLESGYQARYDSDAQKPFLAAVAALNQSYVANGIGKARAAAQAKGSLGEVTALDAEKAAIEKGGGVPAEDAADTPASLKALRGTYRGALAKITAEHDAKAAPLLDLYLKALDVYIAELTKTGKIDAAKQVQTLRDAKAATPPLSGAGGDKIP